MLSLYVISVFLLYFTGILQAAVMPVYQRLQPVSNIINAPTSVALDIYENIYVAESSTNRVLVYNSSGNYIKKLSWLETPISVAVDISGNIYVGNSRTGNVAVYDKGLTFLFKLGAGNGEFRLPNDIAIGSSGKIYVADSGKDRINIYNSNGSLNTTFGSSGNGNGQFNKPLSVEIDETAGEIVVLDRQLINDVYGVPVDGARIQVFDMNGVFKRGFSSYGQDVGKLFRPQHVAIDRNSRLYITDSFHNVVLVYDTTGAYLGAIYDLSNPMRTPLGITIGRSNRLFISSLNRASVEIYGIDTYTDLEITPLALAFIEQQNSDDSATQDIDIKNKGSQPINWTASADMSWIKISETSGTTLPGQSDVINTGVDVGGLTAGTYTGIIFITSETGAQWKITVTLTVTPPPPTLSVNPLSLKFTSYNGAQPPALSLSITNTGGGVINWTASSDSTWILINKNKGTVSSGNPDTLIVAADITSKSQGTYTGNITIAGGGSLGSPVVIPVTLDIYFLKGAINVTTNLAGATFTINGPESFTGSGTSWTQTGVLTGSYTIIYGDVAGYTKPSSETRTLQANNSINFNGQYQNQAMQITGRDIITGAGPGSANPALVKVFKSDGTPAGIEFVANDYKYGVNVAAGDIDNDGYDEIITAPGPGSTNPAEINIYDRYGSKIDGLSIVAYNYKYGANVACGDFNGDGSYEIVTGTGKGSENQAYVKIFVYDSAGQNMADSGINLLAYSTKFGVRVAAADIDGDGISELITAPGPGTSNKGLIKIWKIDTTSGIGQWSATPIKEFTVKSKYYFSVSIAGGDIEGDGSDEIITGAGPFSLATDKIMVYDGEGNLYSKFRAKITNYYGVNIAGGDLNEDGVAEIIAGAGPGKTNSATVKVFDAFGTAKASFKAMDTKYGVNVAVGRITD
jgi:sugar lactone lactonase YvrE